MDRGVAAYNGVAALESPRVVVGLGISVEYGLMSSSSPYWGVGRRMSKYRLAWGGETLSVECAEGGRYGVSGLETM